MYVQDVPTEATGATLKSGFFKSIYMVLFHACFIADFKTADSKMRCSLKHWNKRDALGLWFSVETKTLM